MDHLKAACWQTVTTLTRLMKHRLTFKSSVCR